VIGIGRTEGQAHKKTPFRATELLIVRSQGNDCAGAGTVALKPSILYQKMVNIACPDWVIGKVSIRKWIGELGDRRRT